MRATRPESPRATKELMAFCAVAKFNSFSKASDFLGSGQPTVTAQVRRLEGELGTTLFDRSKRPVQLTPAGMRLATLALPLFDDLAGLMQRITGQEIDDIVRVASSAAMTDHVLPDVIRAFLSVFPGTQVQLRAHVLTDMVDLVEAREVDLGVLPVHTNRGGLDFHPLFNYPWLLIAPPGHPVLQSDQPTLNEIARWPIIIRRHSTSLTAWTALVDLLRHNDLPYRVVLELDQMDSIKKYVGIGLGISLLPEFALEPSDLSRLRFREMTHLFPKETAGYIRPKAADRHPKVQEFIDTLESSLGRRSTRPAGTIEWQRVAP